MQTTVSINTSNVAIVCFIWLLSLRGEHLSMIGVLLAVCLVPAAMSIIVTDPPPPSTEYNYSYNVVDPHTGDTKSLHEVRSGDVVTGSYSVIDPDGTQRIVEYSADSRKGFKAVVHSEPLPVAFHHAARDHRYVPRGSARYVNQYYSSSHTLHSGLSESRAANPSGTRNRQKNKFSPDNRQQQRYFTPANEIKPEPIMFKRGEYFAPNN